MANKRNVRTSSSLSAEVTTTISVALVLFLLGLTIFIAEMGREISTFIKENISITIELSEKDSNNQEAINRLQNKLSESPYIKSITFISKDEIKKELIEELGEDPEDILGYTPASNYFDINLKSEYANPDSIKVVEKSLKDQKIIKSLMYSEEALHMINSNLSRIAIGFAVLAVILLIISFTLIRNTIKLNIYSKRFLINTMQLVGATNRFIRKPFIVKAVIGGIIAAIIANIGITALIYALTQEFPELLLLIKLDNLIAIYVIVLILGIAITYLTTRFAVNKYLKMETNNLYYI